MPPPNDHDQDQPSTASTWLVIPYFDNDLGRKPAERPVPPSKGDTYHCRSILVDGVPGGTTFKRGVPISVDVLVANWGRGTVPAAALVRLWWADPTLVFAKATLFGQATVAIPPTGVPVRVGSFRVTIPEGVSPHVCLLAQASAPMDPSSGPPRPYDDRHWAQLNLLDVTASAAGPTIIPVVLGNPFPFAVSSSVFLSAMSEDGAGRLSRDRGFDIRVGGRARLETQGLRNVALDPNGATSVPVSLAAGDAVPGMAQGYVLTQRLTKPGGEETLLEGSIGILVNPPS